MNKRQRKKAWKLRHGRPWKKSQMRDTHRALYRCNLDFGKIEMGMLPMLTEADFARAYFPSWIDACSSPRPLVDEHILRKTAVVATPHPYVGDDKFSKDLLELLSRKPCILKEAP